ncbi:MAG: hypothetical protein IKV79_04250, partial [Oscillospiraceae bacterium]|nr:hypothetical protein [Oscillospiraceae bacterium]
MEIKKVIGRVVEKPEREPSLNMLTMADIITGVNAVLNPGKPPIDWFAPAKDAVAAVHVKDGKATVDNPAVMYDGSVSDSEVRNLKVVAYNGNEGGIYAEGAATDVTLDGAYISLAGDGEGIGGPASGAAAKYGAKLTIRDAIITTTGRTKYSTAAEEGSVLKVYDSVIWSHGIPYGENIPAPTALMSTPPPPLEIEGNTRTHCTMSNSQSYFYNSKIICDGWAALSTESSEGYVYLEANDCDIVCTKNGYGAYSDPGCHDVFNRCNLEMARMAAIVAGNSDMTFTDCEAKCGSYFALMHCVNGWQQEVSELTITGGTIRTKKEAILIKSHNALIDMEGVDIASEKGILVHSIVNDDPCTTPVDHPPFGVNVSFEDMSLEGDLIHEDPIRDMWVSLKSTLITGAIKGATLSMDKGSKWIATADSDITLLTDLDPAQIDAAEGITVTV